MNAEGLCRRGAWEAGFGLAVQDNLLLMSPFELFPLIWSILGAFIPVAETFVWLWRFPMVRLFPGMSIWRRRSVL